MKTLYYFSKSKLKFVEIKNFYRKFLFLVLFCSVVFSFFIFGTYFVTKELSNPDAEVNRLQTENKELQEALANYEVKYNQFISEMDKLDKNSNDLRLATNLDPITEEDRTYGIGGSLFDDQPEISTDNIDKIVSRLDSYLSKIDYLIEFEKKNYLEIENKLKDNSLLYNAIPAIKPAAGRYGDKFGLRLHPILKIRRMHNGIDILANLGSSVYAPGAGKVIFVGRKGGHGKCIEIDHGFGYKTLYSHLSKYKVKKGQKVKRGDLIALSGSSGKLSTGPHLHYELRHNGIALDPRNFIFDDVKIFEINNSNVKLNME